MRCCVKAEHPPPALFTSCPHCTKCDLVVEKMDKRIRIGAVAVLWHFFLLLLFLLKGTWQHTGFWGFLLTELKESWFLLLLSQTQDSIGIHPAGSTDWIDFLQPEAWDRRDLVSTCLSFLFSSCQPPASRRAWYFTLHKNSRHGVNDCLSNQFYFYHLCTFILHTDNPIMPVSA